MLNTFEKDLRSGKDRRSGRERRHINDSRFEYPPDLPKGPKRESLKVWRIIDLRSGKDRRSGQDRRKSDLGEVN